MQVNLAATNPTPPIPSMPLAPQCPMASLRDPPPSESYSGSHLSAGHYCTTPAWHFLCQPIPTISGEQNTARAHPRGTQAKASFPSRASRMAGTPRSGTFRFLCPAFFWVGIGGDATVFLRLSPVAEGPQQAPGGRCLSPGFEEDARPNPPSSPRTETHLGMHSPLTSSHARPGAGKVRRARSAGPWHPPPWERPRPSPRARPPPIAGPPRREAERRSRSKRGNPIRLFLCPSERPGLGLCCVGLAVRDDAFRSTPNPIPGLINMLIARRRRRSRASASLSK